MSTDKKDAKMAGNTKVFDATSAGFLYTLYTSILIILAGAGVTFSSPTDVIAGDLVTTFSTGGIYALGLLIVGSILFPIYNAWKKGDLTFKGIISSTLTWIAVVNIALAAFAMYGLSFPEGTVEQVFAMVKMKDWGSLAGFFVTTILPTVVRWIKSRNADKVTA